jgi:hypothetical protein
LPRKVLDVDSLLVRLFTPVVDPRGIDGGERPFVEHTPEQRLLFALLVDALRCAVAKHMARQREARQWILSDARYCGAFVDVCEALELSSRRLRYALLDGTLEGFRFTEEAVERIGLRPRRGRRRKLHQEAA